MVSGLGALVLGALVLAVAAEFDVREKPVAGPARNVTYAGEAPRESPEFWGTWRPNLYVGLRGRAPESLLCGLLWTNALEVDGISPQQFSASLRHEAIQNDEINGYGYTAHNGRDYAAHVVPDTAQNLNLETEWVLFPGPLARLGKPNSGDKWILRVRGTPIDANVKFNPMLFFYVGRQGKPVRHGLSPKKEDTDSTILLASDETATLGRYQVTLHLDTLQTPKAIVKASLDIPPADIWKVKSYITKELLAKPGTKPILKSAHDAQSARNSTAVVQLIFQRSFTFDMAYSAAGESLHSINAKPDDSDTEGDTEHLITTPDGATSTIKDLVVAFATTASERREAYLRKFSTRFPVQRVGESMADSQVASLALAAVSNLVGGIGYFYGEWVANNAPDREEELFEMSLDASGEDMELDEEDVERAAAELVQLHRQLKEYTHPMPPVELLTCTPSRTFFPRGFLWDEGFHQLVVVHWDPRLAKAILESWYALADSDGWIAREQILGAEARERVPPEFRVQSALVANPPALMLAVETILNGPNSMNKRNGKKFDDGAVAGGAGGGADDNYADHQRLDSGTDDKLEESETLAFLARVYPIMRRQFEWLVRTQAGKPIAVPQGGQEKSSSSPTTSVVFRWRGCTPNHNFGSGLDDYPRPSPLQIDDLHADLGSWIGYAAGVLSRVAARLQQEGDAEKFARQQGEIEQAVVDHFWDAGERRFGDIAGGKRRKVVVHAGYLTLLPFILGNSRLTEAQVDGTLELIRNELLGACGVRSLSPRHALFRRGEDYWRGNVWANFQYLLLRALYRRAYHERADEGEGGETRRRAEYLRLYRNVRTRFIKCVAEEYQRTGHFYESYHEDSGKGKGWRPFTGWTSQVALVISEYYN